MGRHSGSGYIDIRDGSHVLGRPVALQEEKEQERDISVMSVWMGYTFRVYEERGRGREREKEKE